MNSFIINKKLQRIEKYLAISKFNKTKVLSVKLHLSPKILVRVVLLLVVVLVTGEKQSQLLVLGLRLEFDNTL